MEDPPFAAEYVGKLLNVNTVEVPELVAYTHVIVTPVVAIVLLVPMLVKVVPLAKVVPEFTVMDVPDTEKI
jgi:hypothetical protein